MTADRSVAEEAPLFGDNYLPGRYLYHYTTALAALGSILPTGTIRLSPFRWMNDPRESKAMIHSLAGDSFEANIDAMEVFERGRHLLQDQTKVAAFTLDVVPTYPSEIYARGFSRARMWAMYAGHTGCCLIFNRERLDGLMTASLDGRAAWSGEVTYGDHGPFPPMLSVAAIQRYGIDRAIELYIETNWRVLLLHKNMDWATEAEYRWIARERRLGPIFVPYEDALVGVVAGPDMTDANRDLLLQYCESHQHVPAARVMWMNGHPNLLPLTTSDARSD